MSYKTIYLTKYYQYIAKQIFHLQLRYIYILLQPQFKDNKTYYVKNCFYLINI